MIRVSDMATRKLREMLELEGNSRETRGLKLMVAKGGCAGLQYVMKLDEASTGDEVVERDGVKFIVDAGSIDYLKNSEIDYEDALSDSGFRVRNPNAARSCGCGTSFEPSVSGTMEPAHPVPDGQACGTG